MLITNHAQVRWAHSQIWCQYHVDFQPEVEQRSWKVALLAVHRSTLLDAGYVFNGTMLFMRQKLQEETTELFSEHPQDKTPVRILVKFTVELPSTSPDALHLANLAMRNNFRDKGWNFIGRNYFDMSQRWTIQQYRLEVVGGFSTSILPFESGLQLQVDVVHKIIRTITVGDMMDDLYQQLRRRFRTNFEEEFINQVQKTFIGAVVMTRYNQKTYRVGEVRMDLNPGYVFQSRDGPLSLAEYFNKAYGITELNMEQPLLSMILSKQDHRRGMTEILIPVSLVVMTGITDEMKNDHITMNNINKFTRLDPVKRLKQLQGFVEDLGKGALTQKLGLEVRPRLMEVEARRLGSNHVPLVMGPVGREKHLQYEDSQADWTRAMFNQHLVSSVVINTWMVVYPAPCCRLVNVFLNMLRAVCGSMGVELREPHRVELADDRIGTYLASIRHNLADMQMVVVVLSRKGSAATYNAVKKLMCVNSPVSSQCIREDTLNKENKSIVTKIALQMQSKLGGELWRIQIPMKQFMVVGIDTYHDTVKKSTSVMGVVASLNDNVTRYFTQTRHQSANSELGNHIGDMIKKAVQVFHQKNNRRFPAKIFIYRDGVGDGQLDQVVEFELPQIRQQLNQLGAEHGVTFNIVFIVVKKRISNRFFLRSRGGGVTNPLPGTIIDNTVTRPEWYDFYVVSQSVRQGTVNPIHYNVIHDDLCWPPERIQKFTYWLTHLYYNWPGTVRVPAPCQYAHKVAMQVGQVLHEPASPLLEELLWYL